MAAAATVVLGGGPGSSPSGSSRPVAADYSVLVVVGALRPAGLLERLLLQIDTGEFWKLNCTRDSRTELQPRHTGREVSQALHNKISVRTLLSDGAQL